MVRTSLDKKLNAEEFLFLSHGEKLFLHEKSCIRITLNKEITLFCPFFFGLIKEFERNHLLCFVFFFMRNEFWEQGTVANSERVEGID